MKKATAVAFAIALGCSVTLLDSARAQPNLQLGQKYQTAPITGETFFCFVTNVGTITNAVVVNVRVHDGRDGSRMQVQDSLQNLVDDCLSDGAVVLAPNQTCGIGAIASRSGSSVVERTVGHCVFSAAGFVKGSLEARRDDDEFRLRADAKPANEN